MAARKKKTATTIKVDRSLPAHEQVLSVLHGRHGKTSAMILGRGKSLGEVGEVIPLGLSVLDHDVLGIGGLPVGRISEVYGPEGSGKSSLALAAIAAAQREGGVAILAENETALQPEWAALHGVDINSIVMIEADTVEVTTAALLDAINSLPKGIGPSIAVWDTVASTPTLREIEEGLIDVARVGELAKHLSRAMRSLTRACARHRTHFMAVNQVRDKIGVMFGSPETTPGGHAIKFHSSIRLRVSPREGFKPQGARNFAGRNVNIKAVKNKLAPPWHECELRLSFKRGWDDVWSTLNYAKEIDIIDKMPSSTQAKNAYIEVLEQLGWPAPEANL